MGWPSYLNITCNVVSNHLFHFMLHKFCLAVRISLSVVGKEWQEKCSLPEHACVIMLNYGAELLGVVAEKLHFLQ